MKWTREFRNGFLLGSLFASAATAVSVSLISTGFLSFTVDYISMLALSGACFWLLFRLEEVENGRE